MEKTIRGSSMVYVNFSPYDNAGRILDYLKKTFPTLIHFSYDHLRLQKGRRTNILTIYRNAKPVLTKKLIPLRTPELLRFISLPAVALLILFQTYYHCRKAKKMYGPIEWYLTVNAYTAWVGNVLKSLGVVKKTIFWVWDYFPSGFPDWRIRLLRWVYWKFDRPAITSSSIVACISKKLIRIRNISSYRIIPIGTNPITKLHQNTKRLIVGLMGMLKTSQGIDFIADTMPELIRRYKNVTVEFIGSGPEELYFKHRMKRYHDHVRWYGYVTSEKEIDRIMRRWSIGLAPYNPTKSNESYWTDPSKIKAYISQGVPVITTNVPSFAKEVEQSGAGIIIRYGNTEAFLAAVQMIRSNQSTYRRNALKLAKQYSYQTLYPSFFS